MDNIIVDYFFDSQCSILNQIQSIKNTTQNYTQYASTDTHRIDSLLISGHIFYSICCTHMKRSSFFSGSVLLCRLFYRCFFYTDWSRPFFQSGTHNWAECSVWWVVIRSTRSAKSHTLHITSSKLLKAKCYQKNKMYLHLQYQLLTITNLWMAD